MEPTETEIKLLALVIKARIQEYDNKATMKCRYISLDYDPEWKEIYDYFQQREKLLEAVLDKTKLLKILSNKEKIWDILSNHKELFSILLDN
jgi:hypothetical protein